MFMYKVAEPNEALIISGARAHHGPEGDAAGLGFKIVVGKGAFYIPGLNTVRRLSLDIHEAELDLECVTTQGIPIGVKAVVIYKIADDFQSIANAARRFLDQEEQMDVKVHNVFAGHLRSIVGSMTVEDLIRNREKLTQATRDSSAGEMQKLGLTIDSLQNQEAVIAQQIAEQLPQVVGEAAKAFGSIGQLTVLNGAEGVGQMFSQVLGMGAAAVPMIRNLLGQNGAQGDGSAPAEPEEAKREPRSRTSSCPGRRASAPAGRSSTTPKAGRRRTRGSPSSIPPRPRSSTRTTG